MEEIAGECGVEISVSIVSHAQIGLVVDLLRDINEHCQHVPLELILTLNLDEALPFSVNEFSYPIRIIRNGAPLGFAANHNQAFSYATGRYFCVLNPDIRFAGDPFRALVACLGDDSVGVSAPLVLGADGKVEDSARRFPSPLRIVCKAMGRCKGSDYMVGETPIHPDWAGGMFLLFPSKIFRKLGGFDQRYFLYYEDVDICARTRLLGYEVAVCPQARVMHYAQRSSHRSFRYLRWHVGSMLRFFLSPVYWRIVCRKLMITRQNVC